MYKYLLFINIIILNSVTVSYALPNKQKAIIQKLISENKFTEALFIIEEQATHYAEDPELLLLKGICYYKTEDKHAQAITTLNKALEESQKASLSDSILYHLAQAHEANYDYINAIKNYNRLQKRIPATAIRLNESIEERIEYCSEQLKQYGASPSHRKISDSIQKGQAIHQTTASSAVRDTMTQVVKVTSFKAEKPKQYTIQVCSMSSPLSDSFFKGQYGFKVIRVGDLYRYIYSVYDSLPAARQDLPKIRTLFPDAFIREFDENKLGQAIDLNIKNLK